MADLRAAIVGLPSAYRELKLERAENGDEYATLGPFDAGFMICCVEATVELWDHRWAERRLGCWLGSTVSGGAVVDCMIEALAHSAAAGGAGA